MSTRKLFSVVAVVVALIIGAIATFMLLNGNNEVKDKEFAKTSDKPATSKIGKFGDSESINTKKTTSIGSEEKKEEDDNSDIVSAVDTEKEKKEKPAKVVTKKIDRKTDQVSVATDNGNSVSVAVSNGSSDRPDDSGGSDEVKEKKTVVSGSDAMKDLKQTATSNKLKPIYSKYGVKVFGSSVGGMYTIDGSVNHAYDNESGNYFLITRSDDEKTYKIAAEVVDKLGAPGNKDKILSAIKEALKSDKPVDLGKGYVRADNKTVAVRW